MPHDAFGNEKDRVGSDPNPFRYCGEYFDVESGSYYLRARYYDPSIGRFTQEDPEKDGLNWYTYCNNNPVLFIDPTGCQYVCADDFGGSSKPEPEPAKKDTAAERKRAHDEEKARALYEANMKEMEENYAEKNEEIIEAVNNPEAEVAENTDARVEEESSVVYGYGISIQAGWAFYLQGNVIYVIDSFGNEGILYGLGGGGGFAANISNGIFAFWGAETIYDLPGWSGEIGAGVWIADYALICGTGSESYNMIAFFPISLGVPAEFHAAISKSKLLILKEGLHGNS